MNRRLALTAGAVVFSAKVFAALVVGVIDGIEGSDYSAFCVPSRHEVLVAPGFVAIRAETGHRTDSELLAGVLIDELVE